MHGFAFAASSIALDLRTWRNCSWAKLVFDIGSNGNEHAVRSSNDFRRKYRQAVPCRKNRRRNVRRRRGGSRFPGPRYQNDPTLPKSWPSLG